MIDTLDRICSGTDLSQDESYALFRGLVKGEVGPIELAGLLTALRTKGETPDEIAGAARALREAAEPFPRPDYACADSCGTGGDGAGTINLSTAAAIVAAEIGIPVVKHGNRSVSSRCGSADLLEALGVRIDPPADVARRCLDQAGICFLFAPAYHPGLRHAMPVRKALGIRTVFNLLGPLVNPARPDYQIVGVYDPKLCAPVARVLGLLGCKRALVVHGSGLDEIALHGETVAALWSGGAVLGMTISAADGGVPDFPLDQIRGSGVDENARAIARLLKGEGAEPHNAAVAINAGALAWLAGRAADLREGARIALGAIGSGRCHERLERFAELSHGA